MEYQVAGGFDRFAVVLGPKSASGGADSVPIILTAQIPKPAAHTDDQAARDYRLHKLSCVEPFAGDEAPLT
jgi:hypothetical protein